VFGLAFLLFLAGLEIDLGRLRGRVLRLAVLGYLVTVVLGVGLGSAAAAVGWVQSPALLAVTLSATSLGLVVAVLKDAGRSDRAVGQLTIAAASVADFGAIVLLTLFFSTSGGSVGQQAVLLVLFAGLIVVAGLFLVRVRRWTRLGVILERLQDTTAEIRVRIAVLLMIALVALASRFGLETILGAFLAGALVGLVDRDSSSHPRFRAKLDAIGYGFLIPVFFVSSGVRLDFTGLVENPAALALVPLFLIALLLVRGVPALLWARSLGVRDTSASALLQATSLPFIVTATQIGTAAGLMSAVTAAALVCAGLLSVAIFPTVALVLLRRPETSATAPVPASSGAPG
jgi:Kef-type K+ transport system membrane component KefB